MILTSDRQQAAVVARARVIAVLGAQRDPSLPAHYVPDYLHRQGFRILPVNPRHLGQSIWGEPVRAHLSELAEPVDIVDVFRRAERLDDHLADFLALFGAGQAVARAARPRRIDDDRLPLPGAVWFQLGIRNDRVAAAMAAAGIDVVQDRCLKVAHRQFRQAGLLP